MVACIEPLQFFISSSLPYAMIWSRFSSRVLLGRREHDHLALRCRPSRPSCGTLPSCAQTARAASARRSRTCAGRCPTGCTWYRGTSRFLRSCLAFGSATAVPAPTGSSAAASCESIVVPSRVHGSSPCVRWCKSLRPIILDGQRPTNSQARRPWTAIDAYIESHRQAFVDDLADLLRIRSVSADSRHAADVRKAADWMVDAIQATGSRHRARSKPPAIRSS